MAASNLHACVSRGSRPETAQRSESSRATARTSRRHERDGLTVRRIDGHPFAPFQVVGEPQPLADVRLLAPVLPSKVVAVGRNYAEHAQEMGHEVDMSEPAIVFLKPSTSVIGPSEADPVPRGRLRGGRLRGRAGRRHRPAVPRGAAGAGPRRGARLHLRQRRQRPRPAAHREAVGAGPRASTPSARSAPGSRPTSTRRTWRSRPRSTASSSRPAAPRRCCAASTSWCPTSARR